MMSPNNASICLAAMDPPALFGVFDIPVVLGQLSSFTCSLAALVVVGVRTTVMLANCFNRWLVLLLLLLFGACLLLFGACLLLWLLLHACLVRRLFFWASLLLLLLLFCTSLLLLLLLLLVCTSLQLLLSPRVTMTYTGQESLSQLLCQRITHGCCL